MLVPLCASETDLAVNKTWKTGFMDVACGIRKKETYEK